MRKIMFGNSLMLLGIAMMVFAKLGMISGEITWAICHLISWVSFLLVFVGFIMAVTGFLNKDR